MAGPSSLQNVGGVIPGKQAPDYSSIPAAAGQMMEALVNAKIAGKKMAGEDLDRLLKGAQMGLPIDPKAIEKTAKKAGLPLMKPDDMHAMLEGQKNPQLSSPNRNTTTAPGGGILNQDLPGATQTGPGGQSTQKPDPNLAVVGAKANQSQQRESVMSGWVKNAIQSAQAQGESQQKQLQLQNTLTDLKVRAANGDNKATGQLMAAGGMPMNMDFLHWTSMDDKHRSAAIDVAAGYESPAELARRTDAISNNLMEKGLFSDPDLANRAAHAIAAGGQIPDSVRASMKPFTMQDLVSQGDMIMKGVQLGIPGDQLPTFAKNASIVGIANALPTGLKPLATQELSLRQQQLGLDAAKYEAEVVHYNAMAAVMDAKARLEEREFGLEQQRFGLEVIKSNNASMGMEAKARLENRQASLDNFKALVEIKKAGGVVPPDLLSNAQNTLAQQMGLDVKEVNNFWHFVTGGTHAEFSPRAVPGLGAAAAGASQTPKVTPSMMDKLKGKIKPPGSGIEGTEEGGPY